MLDSSATLTDPRSQVEPITIDADEAADVLGVAGRRAIYALVHDQGLPHVQLGPRRMGFRRQALEDWAAARERTSR